MVSVDRLEAECKEDAPSHVGGVMHRSIRPFFPRSVTLAVPFLMVSALLAACAGTSTPPSPNGVATAAVAGDPNAPCGPNDCTPCDETKQKCMGPMVCDNHPGKASRQCKRDTDGTCKDTIGCADTP